MSVDVTSGSVASGSVTAGRPTVDPAADPAVAGLVAAAAAGDRVAGYRLMAVVQPAVLRYCRARLGSGAQAVDVAHRVCLTFEATLADLVGSRHDLRSFVHRIAVGAVDAVVGEMAAPAALPGISGMLPLLTSVQREVLVLRVAVGLSAEETAATLDRTAAAVRRIQHDALDRLRGAH